MCRLLRRGSILVLAASLWAVTYGCDCKAILVLKKSDPRDLTFTVGGGGGICGDTAVIGTIEAYRGKQFEHIWQVEYPGREFPVLREFTYGRVPEGFVEKKAAAPLATGDEIFINIYGPGYRGKARVVVGQSIP